jgi:hypothetical protein
MSSRFEALKLLLSGLLGLTYAFLMCWQLSVYPVWWLGCFYYAIPASILMGICWTIIGCIKIVNPSLCSQFDDVPEKTSTPKPKPKFKPKPSDLLKETNELDDFQFLDLT